MSYELEHHSPVYNKKFGKQVCKRCGLLYLDNYLTSWAIKMGCNYEEHTTYKQVRVSLVEKWRDEHN